MSIKLPHKLAAWESQLRIFPEEIALALGPLIQKIAALLGPFPHHHEEGHAVPDGFAGLDKHGTYDRLIASDWLLADELPEEFMRRSVMGEHLFWKLAWREPAQTGGTLVLFDAGPEQLGAPRLLHLAALAVFDARARMAKANFNWGILQSAEQQLLPGANVAEVEILLNARGSTSAQPEHFSAWMRRASDVGHQGEFWVVGSERLRRFLPHTFSSLLITDLPLPGERKLRADCWLAGKHSRQIELELPRPTLCAQLLRDPFSTAVVARQKLDAISPVQSMVFNPTGNKLWISTKQGNIIAVPVPNSPRETVGKPKSYQTLSSFPQVAVGRVGRATVLVSMDPVSRSLSLQQLGKRLPGGLQEGKYEVPDSDKRPFFQPDELKLCLWHGVREHKAGLYILDHDDSLWRLFADRSGRWCEAVFPRTLAVTRTHSSFCCVVYTPNDGGLIRVYLNGLQMKSWPSPASPYKAFLGYGLADGNSSFGQLALGYREDHWEIRNGRTHTEITVPKGFNVHGVVQDDNYEETLIVVEDDLQSLSLHGAHGTRRLTKANAPITLVCGCQQLPFIAYSTEAGEISVYSLKHGRAVLDFARSAI